MSKYGNKRVTVDGISFDSIAESKYYLMLKEKKRKGEVTDFQLQVPYIVRNSYRDFRTGKMKRAAKYIPDFVVQYPDGTEEIIDVKGYTTDLSKFKRELCEERYGVPVIWICLLDTGKWITYEEREKKAPKKPKKKVSKKKII